MIPFRELDLVILVNGHDLTFLFVKLMACSEDWIDIPIVWIWWECTFFNFYQK